MAPGACVAFATRYARRGRRVPTNTVSPSWISRAARSTIRSRGARVGVTRAPFLLAAELRGTLLHVGGKSLLGILAREKLLLQLALDRQRLAERNLEAGLDGALDAAHGLRGLGGREELPRVLHHLRVEALRLEDVVHEAHRVCVLERERRAGRHELDRTGLADQAREALRAAGAGEHAERDLGEADLSRVLLGEPDVRGHRDLQAAAHAVTVEGRDHQLRRLLQAIQRLVRVEAEE